MSERNKVMVWVKRGLVGVALLIVVGILVTAVGYRRLRGVPEWYTVRTFTAEQLQKAAQAAENKLIGVQNWAGEQRAAESAATQRGATQPGGGVAGATRTVAASQPTRTTVVELTEDEINALFQKWLAKSHYLESVNKYLQDPVMVLDEGRVIVAGRLKEVNAVASAHFEPKVDEKGNLDLKLVKVLGGNLPLPRAVWASQRDKAVAAVSKHLPEWRRQAVIDSTGIANNEAITAALTQVLLRVLRDEVSEPVVFLPVVGKGGLAARLVGIKIEEKTLSATVTPMTAGEREGYLKRLKGVGAQGVNVAVGG